jgi:hypothetical protein
MFRRSKLIEYEYRKKVGFSTGLGLLTSRRFNWDEETPLSIAIMYNIDLYITVNVTRFNSAVLIRDSVTITCYAWSTFHELSRYIAMLDVDYDPRLQHRLMTRSIFETEWTTLPDDTMRQDVYAMTGLYSNTLPSCLRIGHIVLRP